MPHYAYTGNELDVFAHARNWKRYLQSQIAPFVAGDVLEVGAGTGTTTRALGQEGVASWTCLEPDPEMARQLTRDFAAEPARRITVRGGTIEDLPDASRFDAILYIDVLEHIEDDAGEAARAAALLSPGGSLVVLSPAHQFLYSPFDRRIGHHRRYNRTTLAAVTPASLALQRMVPLDAMGMLLSLANAAALRSASPTVAQIRLWDRLFIPLSRAIDPLLGRRVGKSILGVWRKRT